MTIQMVGDLTAGSPVVTNVITEGLSVGMYLNDTQGAVPNGTTIIGLTSSTITMSTSATGSFAATHLIATSQMATAAPYSPSAFLAQFPEFSSISNAGIQTWISASAPLFNVERWGALYATGVGYWVAHQLALAKERTEVGSIDVGDISLRAGDLSEQRDPAIVKRQQENPYMRTTYGQQFYYFMKLVGMGGTVAGDDIGELGPSNFGYPNSMGDYL